MYVFGPRKRFIVQLLDIKHENAIAHDFCKEDLSCECYFKIIIIDKLYF